MRRHSKIKILFGILIAVILITAFGVGLYLYENYGNDRSGRGSQNLDKELKFGNKTYKITHDIEAYLLIGTDDSMKEEAEETGETAEAAEEAAPAPEEEAAAPAEEEEEK